MSHADQHLTDLRVFRIRAGCSASSVTLAWDYPGATLVRVRILRSRKGYAAGPDDTGPGREQRTIYDGDTGRCVDEDVRQGSTYYCTVFARQQDGPWVEWARRRLRPARPRPLWLRLLGARLRALGVAVWSLVRYARAHRDR